MVMERPSFTFENLFLRSVQHAVKCERTGLASRHRACHCPCTKELQAGGIITWKKEELGGV